MLFEEDDFVLKPISILNEEFSMAIHPTSPSPTGRMRQMLSLINLKNILRQ